jgi:hypothetical protein
VETTGTPSTADPFGTESIRRRVLAAWAASPARFREDANAEEDAVLGAYRDRLVVELLQNAVDAAAAVPGRVHIRLRTGGEVGGDAGGTGVLDVANTGAPLTADGVEALSTLRASAKRDAGAIGRFGAGFAAVLAVSDTPSIVSRFTPDGTVQGVRWSKAETTAVTTETGAAGLRRELARRRGAVPVLRLPFPVVAPAPPPDGYDTVVRLPLRDTAAARTARDLLAGFDPTLPLVLPGLVEIVLDVDGEVRTHACVWERRGGEEVGEPPRPEPDPVRDPTDLGTPGRPAVPLLDDAPVPPSEPGARTAEPWAASTVEIAVVDGRRWRGCVRRGTIPAELLADRPVEERSRTGYEARALVCDGGWPDGVPRVVRAPQPTDERVSLPVLVSVELPLEPSRRHTVAGPLRDWLTDRLAEAVVALAVHLGAGGDGGTRRHSDAGRPPPGPAAPPRPLAPDPLAALELVPSGLPEGEVDGRLRDGVARMLPDAPLLPDGRTGRECVVCDLGPATGAVTALLAADEPVVDGLLPSAYASRRWRKPLDALGVRRLDSAGVVEILTGVPRPPSWWAGLYAILISAPDRDALGALPVPVAVAAGHDDPAGPDEPDKVGRPDGAGRPADAASAATLQVRMVTGPRGVLLPTDGLDVVALAGSGLPLRVVHPDACDGAARDALRTLGAVEGTPAGVLRDPAVREAVAGSDPDDDPDRLTALAGAVLALVRDAGLTPADTAGELSWLADLLLPDVDGEFVAAGELLIADGSLDRVVARDAPFGTLDAKVADAWPHAALEAVGVLRTFGVLRAVDVPLDPDEQLLLDLDDSDTWVDAAADSPVFARPATGRAGGPVAPPVLRTFAAVRDLELVDPAAWPSALAELARPPLREVVLGPEPSYTRWWLARHALLPVADSDGGAGPVRLPPPELRLPDADPLLAGLFSPGAPLPGVDVDLLRRLGCRLTLDDVLGDLDGVLDLLDRLGDADRDVSWPAARALYVAAVTAAARLAAGPEGAPGGGLADGRLDPPLTVRTPDGVVDTADAVLVDAPDLLPLLGPGRSALRVPLDRAAEVAYVLGVTLASAVGDCPVTDDHGPAVASRQAPDGTPYQEHDRLLVADLDGRPTRVPWRVVGGIGGEIHVDAAAGTDALARALAWRAGGWYRRHALAAALRDPAGTAFRNAEDDLDDL